MKIITTYLADDNMPFNSKEECENYERYLFSENNTLNNTLNRNLNNELKIINENFCLELDKDTNEFHKITAYLMKFFNEIFISLKQCGFNYNFASQN